MKHIVPNVVLVVFLLAALVLTDLVTPSAVKAESYCQNGGCDTHEVARGDTLTKMSQRFGCMNQYWYRNGVPVGYGTIFAGEKLQCCKSYDGLSTLPVPPTKSGITRLACGKMSIIRAGAVVNTDSSYWDNWNGPASRPGVIPPALVQEFYVKSYGCWHVVRQVWDEYRWSTLKGIYVKVQKSYQVRITEEGLTTVWP